VSEFRRLFLKAVTAGTLAGLVWFAVQYIAVIPLIDKAESYEARAPEHHEEGWHPAEGWQRNSFTAAATVLAGIGFAAVFFSVLSLTGQRLDRRTGALCGLAGFVCVSLAPALGLPPQPPGAAAADVFDRQLWWFMTVVATAVGLYLIAPRSRRWWLRIGGVMCVALPHAIGAPVAAEKGVVPAELARQFAIASLAASAAFWLALGVIAGFVAKEREPLPPS
jgi:cobalt transporter subunit CbtA